MKKIFLLLLLISLSGCTKNIGVADELKLKTDGDKVLYSREVDNVVCGKQTDKGKCENKGKIISYAYPSNEELSIKTLNGITEDVNKRTHNARFFNKGNNKWTALFYADNSFVKDSNNKWHTVEFATTTIEAFAEQMKGIKGTEILGTNYYGGSDGFVNYDDATYSNSHDASVGEVTRANACEQVYSIKCPTYIINRVFVPFNTEAIPDSATIDTAAVSMTGCGDTYGEMNTGVRLIQTTQADPTSLAVADYSKVGTTAGTDDDLTYNNYNVADEVATWTMNSIGKGWINKTGYTKLGFRQVPNDVVDSAPSDCSYADFHLAATTGTDKDPVLAITYTEVTSSCTAPAAGNWQVKSGDNCYVNSNTTVQGNLYILNTGSGSFNVIDGATLSVHNIENTSTPINVETTSGAKITLDGQGI